MSEPIIEVGDRVSNGVVGGRVLAVHKGFAWITGDKVDGPLTFPFSLLRITAKRPTKATDQ